jgi:hypothetical protein
MWFYCHTCPLWLGFCGLFVLTTTSGFVNSFTPSQSLPFHRSAITDTIGPGLQHQRRYVALLSSVFTQEPTAVFSDLVNGGATALGLEQILDGWIELQELMEDGDLLTSELNDLFVFALKKRGEGDKLDERGFVLLYTAIDSLFEDVVESNGGDDAETDDEVINSVIQPDPQTFCQQKLVSFLADNTMPCGFECTDKERELIQAMVTDLEIDPTNLAQLNNGQIDAKRFIGEWKMLYTSSRTMIINKSLSGLGRSTSTMAPFVRLVHRMTGSKFLGKCEYVETFGTGPESFDVTVTGEWMLKNGVNPITGMSNTVLWVDLEKVMYGFSTNDAEEWASLGPIKRMDIIYMKEDLLITRGSVNTDSIFVYQRINA